MASVKIKSASLRNAFASFVNGSVDGDRVISDMPSKTLRSLFHAFFWDSSRVSYKCLSAGSPSLWDFTPKTFN